MKKTFRLLGASLLLAIALCSCTITPEQAAHIELLRDVYKLTVTVQK